ncbi:MAG: hypothetical protein ACK58T_13035, partial [Phycisphaerae bacterium]
VSAAPEPALELLRAQHDVARADIGLRGGVSSRPAARLTAAPQLVRARVAAARLTAEAAACRGIGTRPSGRTQVTIVFMVTRQLPRHRFNQDRSFGGRWMRYAIRAATAAFPMPPL